MNASHIEKLSVQNFRNLEATITEFSPGINCILGDNGNGKTNLLEAIYYLTNRKSFRKNTSFTQIISMDVDNPEIYFSSVFSVKGKPCNYSGKWRKDSSEWYANGKPTKKRLEIKSVFINPFDSHAFHNTPAFRRQWVDQHLSILDSVYKKTLNNYTSALKFRNNLLSNRLPNLDGQLDAIDLGLAEYAFLLTRARTEFVARISEMINGTFKRIFSEEHQLNLYLDTRYQDYSHTQIAEALRQNRDKDKLAGRTTYCVHRDDYQLNFDGVNSYDFCSLGQQKMSYLSLIFAYIELFRYKLMSYPIVLIDDVSGELDKVRWERLILYLKEKEFQVLITTANEDFKKELEKIGNVEKLFISTGKIQKLIQ